MKKSNALLMSFITFVVGVVVGLFIASFSSPPPGLENTGRPQAPAGEMDHGMAAVQAKLAELRKQIEADPEKVSLYVEAGNLLFDHQAFEMALTYYAQAVELGGPEANVLTDMGVCYRRLKQPEKAVEFFRKARTADPNNQIAALNLGIVLLHDLNRKQEALEAWRAYLSLNPTGEKADLIRKVVSQLDSGAMAK